MCLVGAQGKRKALIIGIGYDTTGDDSESFPPLKLTRENAVEMKKLLIEVCGFKEENIIMMLDEKGTSDDLNPTSVNIRTQLQNLCSNAGPWDSVVLYYAGHGHQIKAERDKEEEDGMDEAMVPMDHDDGNNVILDDSINDYLVKGFSPHAKLTMIFDCCHSQSIADLTHHRCNKHYDRWMKCLVVCRAYLRFNPRKAKKGSIQRKPKSRSRSILPTTKTKLKAFKMINRNLKCTGWCKVNPLYPSHDITCISACRDQDVVCETDRPDGTPGTFTEALIKIMRTPGPATLSWNKLVSRLDEENGKIWDCVHRRYYHPSDKHFLSSQGLPGPICHPKFYTWRTQLSSQHPLNMKAEVSFTRHPFTFPSSIYALMFIHSLSRHRGRAALISS